MKLATMAILLILCVCEKPEYYTNIIWQFLADFQFRQNYTRSIAIPRIYVIDLLCFVLENSGHFVFCFRSGTLRLKECSSLVCTCGAAVGRKRPVNCTTLRLNTSMLLYLSYISPAGLQGTSPFFR